MTYEEKIKKALENLPKGEILYEQALKMLDRRLLTLLQGRAGKSESLILEFDLPVKEFKKCFFAFTKEKLIVILGDGVKEVKTFEISEPSYIYLFDKVGKKEEGKILQIITNENEIFIIKIDLVKGEILPPE